MKPLPAVITFFILLIIHIALLVNLRFEAWPEMLVYPYLNLHGFQQYRDIIHPYPPLPIWFLAGWFRLVEISVANLQLLTWGLIAAIDGLLFWITSKRYGSQAALIGISFFVLFQPLLDGNGLWFDLLLVPLLLLAYHRQSAQFLAVSFFVKQSTIWLFPLFFKQWKKLVIFLVPLFIIHYSLFTVSGTAADYWFWSWRFPFTLFPAMPGHKDLGHWRLWVVGITPLLLPLMIRLITTKKLPKISSLEPIWWMILSTPFVLPRFGLFHFQPALAFASLSLAASWHKLKKLPWLPLFIIPYSLFVGLLWFRQLKYFWHQPTRFFESQIIQAARSLETITTPDRPVLFLNAPDQLFVLANRLPPKPWIGTFPWYLEVPNIQNNAILRWKTQSIQALVFSPYSRQEQYTPGSYIPQLINTYAQNNFPSSTFLNQTIQLKSPLSQ